MTVRLRSEGEKVKEDFMKNKKHWDTVIEVDDGWSIRHMDGGYWYVYTPEGYSVRYPAFITKEGALAEWRGERKRHETETRMISRCLAK